MSTDRGGYEGMGVIDGIGTKLGYSKTEITCIILIGDDRIGNIKAFRLHSGAWQHRLGPFLLLFEGHPGALQQ